MHPLALARGLHEVASLGLQGQMTVVKGLLTWHPKVLKVAWLPKCLLLVFPQALELAGH